MTNKLNNPFKVTELINAVNELDTDKQDTLISGTNIKTINETSILGSGNLTVTVDTDDCVHLTGDETITGTKTFNTSYTIFKGINIDVSNNPTVFASTGINYEDISSVVYGQDFIRTDTDGNLVNTKAIRSHTGNRWANLTIGFDANDNVFTNAPTPSAGDNSTQIATTAFVKAQGYAIDSGLVHTTNDETISGVKTFNNPIHFNSSVFVDAAGGNEGGEIEFAKAPNSSLTGNVKLDIYQNSMRIFGPASNGDIRNIMNADIEQNALFVPSSDKASAAVSTVSINKNQSGYVKLGNGIIIQYGTSTSSGSQTITFPTSFTSTNYRITGNSYGTSYCVVNNSSKTTTSVIVGNNVGFDWIAIGY